MEIRFRPMPPATLTREVKNARSTGEDGQSFIDVVETLTSADQTPEQNPDPGSHQQQPPPQRNSHNLPQEPDPDTPEQVVEEIPTEPTPDTQNPQSPTSTDPEENPPGTRLDLTA